MGSWLPPGGLSVRSAWWFGRTVSDTEVTFYNPQGTNTLSETDANHGLRGTLVLSGHRPHPRRLSQGPLHSLHQGWLSTH